MSAQTEEAQNGDDDDHQTDDVNDVVHGSSLQVALENHLLTLSHAPGTTAGFIAMFRTNRPPFLDHRLQ